MGILFVMLILAAIFFFLGIPAAVALGVWSWRNQKRSPDKVRRHRSIVAAILPYMLVAYGGAIFIIYGLWCESARHVDAGIGDSAKVPIGNGHFFCMIDLPDKGYILKGSCSGSPAIDEITELAVVGDRIIGNSQSNGFFIFNTKTEAIQKFDSLDLALNQFAPRPLLKNASSFYVQLRWGWADAITLLIAGIPAIGIIIFWYKRFIS